MPSDVGIVHVDSVRRFFEEAVGAAIARHPSFCPDSATTAYVVELLCEFIARPPDISEPLSAVVLPESRVAPTVPPTAPRRSAAARWTRIQQLKRAGDHSLYVAGYFHRSLRRRSLDLEYYRTMGGAAYRRLSYLVAREGETQLRQVYSELAGEFPEFASLLAEVRAHTGGERTDALELYEEWLASGSQHVRRRLQEAGFVISPSNCKNN